MNELYILLPVHNRCEVTRSFLCRLLRQTFTGWRLILIDDGSVDGTSEMAAELVPAITIVKGNGSLWWAGSLQAGIGWLRDNKVSRDSAVLIINDDTEFDEDFLQKALEALAESQAAIIKPYVYSSETGSLLDAGVHMDWGRLSCTLELAPERINCLSTRGLFMRLSDLERIGGFFPRLLPHLLSDYEFCIRARRKGLSLVALPSPSMRSSEVRPELKGRNGTLMERLRYLRSYKSYENPIDWFFFVLLAAPWRYKAKGALVAAVRGAMILSGIDRYRARSTTKSNSEV